MSNDILADDESDEEQHIEEVLDPAVEQKVKSMIVTLTSDFSLKKLSGELSIIQAQKISFDAFFPKYWKKGKSRL